MPDEWGAGRYKYVVSRIALENVEKKLCHFLSQKTFLNIGL